MVKYERYLMNINEMRGYSRIGISHLTKAKSIDDPPQMRNTSTIISSPPMLDQIIGGRGYSSHIDHIHTIDISLSRDIDGL